MKYSTRDFGEMEIQSDAILHFSQPPFGFESYKNYALIYDKEIGSSIVWMQSLDEPALCFLLMDPSSLAPYFAPQLPDGVEKLLGRGEYDCWVMMSIPSKIEEATVNLKSPIFLNLKTNQGAQIMLQQDYPVRFPLKKKEEAE
jgi:flagellar assembly factor FliW